MESQLCICLSVCLSFCEHISSPIIMMFYHIIGNTYPLWLISFQGYLSDFTQAKNLSETGQICAVCLCRSLRGHISISSQMIVIFFHIIGNTYPLGSQVLKVICQISRSHRLKKNWEAQLCSFPSISGRTHGGNGLKFACLCILTTFRSV